MIFLRDSFCLSAVSLSRQRHDILDFPYCPLPRVLHVTLVKVLRFGFEFHLRSSPSAFCGYGRAVDLITSLLATPCWPYQARSKQRLTSVTRHESSELKQITVKDNWTSANVQFSGSVTSGPTELPNTEKEKIPPTVRDTMTKGTRVTWDESKAKLPWQTESGNIAV